MITLKHFLKKAFTLTDTDTAGETVILPDRVFLSMILF